MEIPCHEPFYVDTWKRTVIMEFHGELIELKPVRRGEMRFYHIRHQHSGKWDWYSYGLLEYTAVYDIDPSNIPTSIRRTITP